MSSTRNRNTYGNYELENNENYALINTYISDSRIYADNHIAGDGLLGGVYPTNALSNRQIEIETTLLGIGSTNLTVPSRLIPRHEEPLENLSHLSSLNVYKKTPVVLPDPLVIRNGQRPTF